MPDIATITQIVLAILGAAVPTVLLIALLRGDDSWSLADLFRIPDYDAWPRGVQEEEPFRWGMERIASTDIAAAENARRTSPIRTAPRHLRVADSARADDPIGEVA